MEEWLASVDEKNQKYLAWLKDRHGCLTASDAACLYNANPYKKFSELYEEKIAPEPPITTPNVAMRRGTELEPILRKRFIEAYKLEDPFEPKWCVHPELPFIAATLDGLSQDGKTLIEIKYVGRKVFDAGVCPKHYWFQIMHQYLASGATDGFLVMGMDEMHFKIIPVPRDDNFIAQHTILCEQFWAQIQSRKAPEPEVQVVEDQVALGLASDYERLKAMGDEIALELEATKELLLKYAVKDKVRINNVSIAKVLTKGSVNYKNIPELKSVDLEAYRGEPRVSYRLTVDSKPLTDV
jgi:putative phage-type endonuclease